MGSDLRTSARDLLTLAQKVSTLLQRKSDRILAEIEDAEATLAPEVEAAHSEQCQQALDLRRSVWETSKRLKGALEHVEDIEDEDEPRILREPMEELQKLVREALNITSDPEARTLLQSNNRKPPRATSPAAVFDVPGSLPIPTGASPKSGVGLGSMMPGTPPLGSVHRHPLGLFSTSPKFTAQSPFTSPARVSVSRLSIVADTTTSSDDPLSPPPPPVASTQPTKSPDASYLIHEPAAYSCLTAVSDGPLSIATATPSPTKTIAKNSIHALDSATSSSSVSSATSFSTPITSPVDRSLSPLMRPLALKRKQSMDSERTDSPRTEILPSPPQQRRVPRGLFSPSSVLQESREGERRPAFWPDIGASMHDTPGAPKDQAVQAKNHFSEPSSHSQVGVLEDPLIIRAVVTPPSLSQVTSSSTSQSPIFSDPKNPTSPKLQRSQTKPTPIQTASPAGRNGTRKTRALQDESEEEISQLARDLERAMNPTPTEPVPQPYFLQGKGLLQRIPSQVSMDDGLLNEEHDSQASEESEDMDDQSNYNDLSGLQRGNGSLRRQRSGGRRHFRFARSRSRNRSKTRTEPRSKPALTPIDIGHSNALTTSAWPFDQSPPAMLSVRALEQERRQSRSRSRSRHENPPPQPQDDQQRQTRAGPHLPFADSVTIGNPIRIGRGIGSFTVYTVALTLCDPTKGANPATITDGQSNDTQAFEQHRQQQQQQQQQQQTVGGVSQRGHAGMSSGAHAGRVVLDPLGVETAVVKPPSMASLMMTRSLSFPGLGSSAERLLMDIQPLPDNNLQPSSTSSLSSPGPTTSTTASSSSTQGQPIIANSVSATPKRVIHVRKRYSDFVTLRAQLAETFKDQRRSRTGKVGRSSRRLFSASTSSATPSSAYSAVATNSRAASNHPSRTQSLGAYYDVGFSDEEDEFHDNDEDEEDNNENNNTSSRHQPSAGTIVNPATQNSIIRGLPKLPPKKVVGKFRPAFVEKRRRELEYFLEWVVAHPVMGDCPVVVRWFLGPP